MSWHLSTLNISSKSMHELLSNLANRQTDRQAGRQTDRQTQAKTCTSSFVGGNKNDVQLRSTMSGVQSRGLVLVIKQLREAVRQQAHDVFSSVDAEWSFAICYRQPQLNVISICIRRLAESRHRNQTFHAVAQPVNNEHLQFIDGTA